MPLVHFCRKMELTHPSLFPRSPQTPLTRGSALPPQTERQAGMLQLEAFPACKPLLPLFSEPWMIGLGGLFFFF